MILFVIPLKTGTHSFKSVSRLWIPACAGMAAFKKTIFVGKKPKRLPTDFEAVRPRTE